MAEKIPTQMQPAPISGASLPTSASTVVVGHFDTHGVVATVLAAKAFGAAEIYCNYPQTSPETLIATLQNLFAAAPSKLRIVLVDIPVNLKDPFAFIQGLESLALRHEIIYIDHHESSLPYISQFRNVRAIFVGTSALQMNYALVGMIPNAGDLDRQLAIIGAIGDRDPEVITKQMWSKDLQEIADGFDVLVRERDGALRTAKALLANPVEVMSEARARAAQIPTAQLEARVGPVAIAAGELPVGWGPKALERLAFNSGAWYAIGVGVDERTKQPVVRAIIRWDVAARMPYLPLPGAIARQIWTTRNVIGHPAAPTIAAVSIDEAREMARQWATALAQAATRSAAPQVTTLISESRVGEALVEVLQRLEQILEEQRRLYNEYLDLKRQQVELLRRATGARAAD
ncbi:MAG: hypothetical protein LM580_11880 [Thermofilum sp.]|nr:hypothetical protein [Thermofilum sp.]